MSGENPYKKYGDFSKAGTEFVISRPDTPRPWINFLSNGDYGVCLSQTGGGYSFFLDPAFARLTRWEPVNWIKNTPGRFLYLRDRASGEVWSAGHHPVNKSDSFACRHGLGYTEITSQYQDLETTSTHFVPRQGFREVWLIRLENKGKETRTLSITPAIEWHLGEWEQELRLRNIMVLMNTGRYDKKNEILIGHKKPVFNRAWPWTAFMASSCPVQGFDLSMEKFMGRYRSWHNPLTVETGRLGNSEVDGENMVGALEHHVSLPPGGHFEFSVLIGAEQDPEAILPLVRQYRELKHVKTELQAVKEYWRGLVLDNFTIATPDPLLNTFVNVWNKYQVVMNNHWGRGVSFYHEGWGEYGYRNTAQDAMGILPLDAGYARQRLIKLAEHQRNTGQPLPGWSLIAGTNDGKPPSDFPMWLPMLLIRYIKETGDKDILRQSVKYHDGGSDTLYDHAVKASRFLQDMAKSERGLPLMGTQDWNDAYDRVGIGGQGESIWLGMGLCFALLNLEELAIYQGDSQLAQECRERYEKEKEIINRLAWDGEWYQYATNDAGEPIGSKANKEGSIPLNSQTWAIIAGIAEGERLEKVLHTIDEKLSTPYGPVLFKPGYTQYDGNIGRITSFAPGTKENAAIFCHGQAFKIYADYLLHRGDQAYASLQQLLPCASNKDIEIYKTEPYVFAEYLIGPENPNFGEGAWTWLTGTADWTLFTITEKLLGVCPEFEGLKIDPCLPRHWKTAGITRKFRGATYAVEIANPDGINHGVAEIIVDGKKLEGNIIPPHGDGQVHTVQVRMGGRSS